MDMFNCRHSERSFTLPPSEDTLNEALTDFESVCLITGCSRSTSEVAVDDG